MRARQSPPPRRWCRRRSSRTSTGRRGAGRWQPLRPSPRHSADARLAAAGRRAVRRMTIVLQAFRSVTPTTGRFRCHTGCDQDKVIATLQSRGLWPEKGSRRITLLAPRSVSKRTEPDRDDAKRTEAALAIWQVAMPAGGSLVETYLGSRGLHLPPTPALRFHARLTHHPGAFGRR